MNFDHLTFAQVMLFTFAILFVGGALLWGLAWLVRAWWTAPVVRALKDVAAAVRAQRR